MNENPDWRRIELCAGPNEGMKMLVPIGCREIDMVLPEHPFQFARYARSMNRADAFLFVGVYELPLEFPGHGLAR